MTAVPDDLSRPMRRIVLYAAVAVGLAFGLAKVAEHQLAPASPSAQATPDPQPAKPVLSEAEQAEVRRGWERSSTIAPRSEQRDPATGEVTLPFHGFGLSVDSTPPGARVLVDGRDLGETPLLASVTCAPGAQVEVRVEKPPLAAARRTTTCRSDTLVKLAVTLAR
ncbi:PEGA domain-containing protein [Anaeromyxobacter paludicola]|uniref:PEGA domain-containing protein n=1 Tax=Anaeromyxobacter paludicola TaxID=2918171 RepID=A0ABM7XCC7_9BACT|nr:PEGA domain-containing protein [Anaeromyxobacter paludicola]BDG09527.1 hypothetical protein AMPC_26400 [Anaeromyxobacter paludicola]